MFQQYLAVEVPTAGATTRNLETNQHSSIAWNFLLPKN
jgi:hypothetical protein